MAIIAWIVLGLLAGLLVKFIMPGKDPGGLIIRILLGIGGALVGGFIRTIFLGLTFRVSTCAALRSPSAVPFCLCSSIAC